MGLFGKYKSLWSGRPGPPKPRAFEDSAYASGAGRRGWTADRAAFKLLQDDLNKKPGYTDEEYRMISEVPREAIGYNEQQQLRGNNQAAAASGKFGSGGRASNEGQIRQGASRNRAMVNMQAPAMAAQFAREDRMRKIGAGMGYAAHGYGMYDRELGAKRDYNQRRDEYDRENWGVKLKQYAKDLEMSEGDLMKLFGMMGGGAGKVAGVMGG